MWRRMPICIEREFNKCDLEISRKWMEFWRRRRLDEADPNSSKPKFYLTAAYPYPNAPLHLGHGRTYLIPDVIARYKRMRGYNVLFPMAFHYTGTPILTMSEAIAKGDERILRDLLEIEGVPREDIPKLTTPLGMANYFREWARKTMRDYLLSIDWRREFTTIDEEYKNFIRWQFLRLREKGYIVQGTHPVGWCPVHQSPVGMHDTKDDVEPEIQEFTLIFFHDENGLVYPAATLRPETVYGVTNIWINPKTQYVIVGLDGKRILLSQRAAFKIKFQKEGVTELGRVEPEELLGKRVFNPITGKWVPVLPSEFVDPDTGTGVVMSVPAHAPYDYVALRETISKNIHEKYHISTKELVPIPLITLEGYSELPAKDVVERLGIESIEETEKLDRATREVYLKEHNFGVMREDLVKLVDYERVDKSVIELAERLAGKPVREIRSMLIEWMKDNGVADSFYEIANKPVYCRCGTEIVVKVLKNQWFIDYENSDWKDIVRKAINTITQIVPPEYKPWFEHTIDWLKKRACARSRGLGTPLPWDPNWIIESLSDSTIYMAFYTVIHKIRKYGINPEKLSPEFWNYILLGEGDPETLSKKVGISTTQLDDIRNEFDYWYPLDNRHSGKDLVPNHLTFMIFNHTALFPKEKWPRRIVVNGHIMIEGQKMSKSLGNFIPLHKAIEKDGPNTLRLALVYSAEIGKDSNYTSELVEFSASLLKRMMSYIEQLKKMKDEGKMRGSPSIIDKWLLSRVRRRVINATEALENYRLREAALNSFSLMEQEYKRYLAEKEEPVLETIDKVISIWLRMTAPFTPAVSEELWHTYFEVGEKSIFEEKWPSPDEISVDLINEAIYEYFTLLVEDITNIKKVSKKEPQKVIIVTASPEKWVGLREITKMIEENAEPREIIRHGIRMFGLSSRGYETIRKLIEFMKSLPSDIREELKSGSLDEKKIIEENRVYLEKKIGYPLQVIDEKNASPQLLKRRQPIPLSPVIHFVF
jgi:leucyl-tRNA synthetase